MIPDRVRIIIISLLTLAAIAGITGEVWVVYLARHRVPEIVQETKTAEIQKAVSVLKKRKPFVLEGTVPVQVSPVNTSVPEE